MDDDFAVNIRLSARAQFYLRNDGCFTPSVASRQTFARQPNGTHPDVDLSNPPTQ
jgi:hypothetical protein